MSVIEFPQIGKPLPPGWGAEEVKRLIGACANSVGTGEASGWEFGQTELGEPQLYLIGPPPDHHCILCISRLGRLYIIEDGNGKVVFEHDNLMLLAEQAVVTLRRRKTAIAARIAVAWCALRETIEEKTEVMMAEPLEVLTHWVPQLGMLA
jgi:hypothetical protein